MKREFLTLLALALCVVACSDDMQVQTPIGTAPVAGTGAPSSALGGSIAGQSSWVPPSPNLQPGIAGSRAPGIAGAPARPPTTPLGGAPAAPPPATAGRPPTEPPPPPAGGAAAPPPPPANVTDPVVPMLTAEC